MSTLLSRKTHPAFRWFAWRPVRTYDRGWQWLRFVWRRRVTEVWQRPAPPSYLTYGEHHEHWWSITVEDPTPAARKCCQPNCPEKH